MTEDAKVVKLKVWISLVRILLGLVCPFSLGILLGMVLIPWVLAYYFDLVFVFKHLDVPSGEARDRNGSLIRPDIRLNSVETGGRQRGKPR